MKLAKFGVKLSTIFLFFKLFTYFFDHATVLVGS